MKINKDSLFWDVYARCYDLLLDTIPYQRLVDQIVAAVPPGARRLFDAGCGTGNLLQALQRAYPPLDLAGLDFSPAMLSCAKAKLASTKLMRGDLNRSIAYPDGTFDVVTCINVLHAVRDTQHTLQELRRVLKQGGTLVVSSPLARPRIYPLVAEHAATAGWMRTIPLLVRMSPVLLMNLLIIRQRTTEQSHFMEMSSVRQLFGDVPISLVYGNQNWFVCLTT